MDTPLLIVSAGVRYWEDATVNGVEDTEGTLIPFRDGDYWCPVIDLRDGTIKDWPKGTTASIHYKVCDDGEYWLADEAGVKRFKWRGDYVPDRFLCHGDDGFGDYIILDVDANGYIQNYSIPSIAWSPPESVNTVGPYSDWAVVTSNPI